MTDDGVLLDDTACTVSLSESSCDEGVPGVFREFAGVARGEADFAWSGPATARGRAARAEGCGVLGGAVLLEQ